MNDHLPHRRHPRAELDRLADGVDDGSELARFLAEVRSSRDVPPTAPNPTLTEFVSAPLRETDEAPDPTRTKPMIAGLLTAAGTTAGKIGLAAAALVAGAIVTDALPPSGDRSEVVAAGSD